MNGEGQSSIAKERQIPTTIHTTDKASQQATMPTRGDLSPSLAEDIRIASQSAVNPIDQHRSTQSHPSVDIHAGKKHPLFQGKGYKRCLYKGPSNES